MTPRDTRTGNEFEILADRALSRGGYVVLPQRVIGTRPGGGRHQVDKVIAKGADEMLVSFKWQQTSGTAEQKVPFEVICLLRAIEDGPWRKAYLVLGGDRWSLRDWYRSGELEQYIDTGGRVVILSTDEFLGRANRGEL